MHQGDQGLTKKNSGGDPTPVEKRVISTVKWVIQKYGIDPNRVYLSGNSMGGSGTLGIGMRHGDVFAAIKANVPAGIEHVSNRMYFPPETVPENVTLPEPPVCIDYSAQNDGWSTGHERFVKAMNERRYALYFYWGPFGHANNSAGIMKTNDLIDSFAWLVVKRTNPTPRSPTLPTTPNFHGPTIWKTPLRDRSMPSSAGKTSATPRTKPQCHSSSFPRGK